MIANEISNKSNQPKPSNLSKNMFEHSLSQITVTTQNNNNNNNNNTQNMKYEVRKRRLIPFS